MGIISYKDVPYGGGGSSVTPNPSGTATDNLEKVQIKNTVYAIKDSNAVHGSDKGTANGVASLNANGKVPSAQLPSYVDDVIEGYYDTVTDRFYEESTFETVIPPEDGKSWVDISSNKSYRWTGSVYVRVDEGVQLGETSNTAYRGDRGKAAYDHATESGKISAAVTSGLYKVAATAEGHIASLTAVVKSDLTDLGLADASSLKDLAFIAKDGTGSTKYLRGDGNWTTFPTIPTVNNSTITIKKNGTTVDSFTLNQSTGKDIDISVPTKTSDLTNDSGYITSYTDEKVTAETKNLTSENAYYIPFVVDTSNQKPLINDGVKYICKQGTASAVGYGILRLGNGTTSGTAGNKYGELRMYSEKNGYVKLKATANSTASRDIYLPDKEGTIALTSDIPTVGTIATIDLGSGSSKFLREDGTWQDTSWDGGTIENNIIPVSGDICLGSSSKLFDVVYTNTLETDWINFNPTNSSYTAVLNSPSTLTSSVNIYLPNASGTLVTDSYLNSNYVKISNDTVLLAGNQVYNNNASANITANGWKNYKFLIIRILYSTPVMPITVPVAFLKTQSNVRFPAVFNGSTTGGYIQVNSTTDSTLNITNAVGAQVSIAVYGLN